MIPNYVKSLVLNAVIQLNCFGILCRFWHYFGHHSQFDDLALFVDKDKTCLLIVWHVKSSLELQATLSIKDVVSYLNTIWTKQAWWKPFPNRFGDVQIPTRVKHGCKWLWKRFLLVDALVYPICFISSYTRANKLIHFHWVRLDSKAGCLPITELPLNSCKIEVFEATRNYGGWDSSLHCNLMKHMQIDGTLANLENIFRLSLIWKRAQIHNTIKQRNTLQVAHI